MRDIKFRAWDKEGSRGFMLYFTKRWILSSDGDCLEIRCADYQRGCVWNGDEDDWVLMQFTELQDKNGKDIYEGDIVRFNEFPINDTSVDFIISLEVIKFELGSFIRVNRKPKDYQYCEVIGNIYENPELLKGGEV